MASMSTIAPARVVVQAVLKQIADPSAPGLEELLAAQSIRLKLSPADTRLAREITAGVLRQRRWLESVLGQFLRHPLQPEHAPLLEPILHAAIYQWLFLDRVPEHAIAFDAVELVKREALPPGTASLVNGVLRGLMRAPRESLLPTAATPWALRYSVPEPLIVRARQMLPEEELEPFFATWQEEAPLTVRLCGPADAVRWGKLSAEVAAQVQELLGPDALVSTGTWAQGALHLPGRGLAPDRLAAFNEGRITVMDEAAQLCVLLAGAVPGSRVLDLCASPGGKTAALWDAMGRRGNLTAADVSGRKLMRLRETLRRLGIEEEISILLAEAVHDEGALHDLVLVDAPCSGLGTVRRHPEVRWRRDADTVTRLSVLQGEILDRAAKHVAPGGILVYSVCTWTREETLGQAQRFFRKHPDFAPAGAPEGFDAEPFAAGDGLWQCWPHRHGTDAFGVLRARRG